MIKREKKVIGKGGGRDERDKEGVYVINIDFNYSKSYYNVSHCLSYETEL